MSDENNIPEGLEINAPIIPKSEPLGYTIINVRNLRDIELSACDWTQASDSPLSDEKKSEWVAYRQELRDLTKKGIVFQGTEDWPTPPSA